MIACCKLVARFAALLQSLDVRFTVMVFTVFTRILRGDIFTVCLTITRVQHTVQLLRQQAPAQHPHHYGYHYSVQYYCTLPLPPCPADIGNIQPSPTPR